LYKNIIFYWQKYKSSGLFNRFASGAFWSIIAAAIARGLTLVTFIILARMIGKSSYGQLGMVQNTLGAISLLAGMGLGMSATKYVAHFRDNDPGRAGKIIKFIISLAVGIAILSAVVIILIAPKLSEKVLNNQDLTWGLSLGSGLLLFGIINSTITGALSGLESYKAIARINFISGVLGLPLILILAKLYGVPGSITGLVVSAAIACFLGRRALIKECRGRNIPIASRIYWEEKSVLWDFTLPAAISGFIVTPIIWTANVMLIKLPDGYSQMGIFTAAQQWQTAIMFLPVSLSPLVLSMLSNVFYMGDKYGYNKLLYLSFLSNGLVALVGTLLVVLLAPSIMRWYGAGFNEGWPVLTLMASSAFLMALSNVVGQVIASSSSMWIGLLLNTMWAIVFLTVAMISVKTKGALGLAQAYAISYFCHLVWSMIYLSFVFKRSKRSS